MQAWPDLCGCTGVAWNVAGIGARAFFGTAGVAGTAGACFIWVAGGEGAADVGCMCGAGGVMLVVLLRSGGKTEPVVWQLCHLGQCQLL